MLVHSGLLRAGLFLRIWYIDIAVASCFAQLICHKYVWMLLCDFCHSNGSMVCNQGFLSLPYWWIFRLLLIFPSLKYMMKRCFKYIAFKKFKLFSQNRFSDVRLWAKGNKSFFFFFKVRCSTKILFNQCQQSKENRAQEDSWEPRRNLSAWLTFFGQKGFLEENAGFPSHLF